MAVWHPSPRYRIFLIISGGFILLLLLFQVTSPHHEKIAAKLSDGAKSAASLFGDSSSKQDHSDDTQLSKPVPQASTSRIENIFNFVFILPPDKSDFNFDFKSFLAIYATWFYCHPEIIYFHTNASPESIEAARDGRRGRWTELIFSTPGFTVNYVERPDKAKNGNEIRLMEHKSDFVRVAATEQFGGIYVDFDAIPIRDLRPIRELGFNVVVGRQEGGQVNSGVFMAKPHALVMERWKKEMQEIYDGGWTTHSNDLITRLGIRLSRMDREVIILEQAAFGPNSWTTESNKDLYGIHNETNNLDGIKDGDVLPDYTESVNERWDHPDKFPSWERDYSNTYILHAFNPSRNGNPVEGFEHVTPRYVLQRQSNYARVFYPVVKHMYDQGLVKIDDPYKYELE